MKNDLKPFVDDDQKKGYETGPVYYYEAKAGAVLADHTHETAETLWVIEGNGKIQIDDKTDEFEAVCRINIPANAYHKFEATTDVKFIELRHDD